jgi:hypothetical protein
MKHEIALAVVVAVGLGVVGATIAIGGSVREPTVVANPYEAGLHHAEAVAARREGRAGGPGEVAHPCDLGAGPCAQQAGPFQVTLALAPRPLRTMVELGAVVELRKGDAPVEGATVTLSFDMRDMSMGPNRRVLPGVGGGRYAGKGLLVRCPSGRKDWVATVAVASAGRPAEAATFGFAVVE